MNRAIQESNGFTLVEVAAGLILLAVGLLGIAAMQVTSTQGDSFSRHLTQATVFAQDRMEYLKSLSYNDSDLSGGEHNEGTLPETIFSRQYHIVEDVGNSMKTITVTVQWADRGNHRIAISTIRSK